MGIYTNDKGVNEHLGFHVVLLLSACVAAYVIGMPEGLIGLPVAAWAFARIFVNSGFWVVRRIHEDAFAEWDGRYYVFDRRQMRLFWDVEAQLFIVANDVFTALDQKLDQLARVKLNARLGGKGLVLLPGIKEACFTQPALEQYLDAQSTEVARRMRLWLSRDIVPLMKKFSEKNDAAFLEHAIPSVAPEDIVPVSLSSKLKAKKPA